MSRASPKTRTRAWRSRARNGTSSVVASASRRPAGRKLGRAGHRLGSELERLDPRPAFLDERRVADRAAQQVIGGREQALRQVAQIVGGGLAVALIEAEREALQGARHEWCVIGGEARRADVVGEQRERLQVVRADDLEERCPPAGLRVVGRRRREIVRDRRERDLRGLEQLHAVRDHAARRAPQLGVAPAIRTDVQLEAHRDVVDRIVVPVQRRPPGRRREPLGVVEVERRRADRPAGPEQVDARVDARAQREPGTARRRAPSRPSGTRRALGPDRVSLRPG